MPLLEQLSGMSQDYLFDVRRNPQFFCDVIPDGGPSTVDLVGCLHCGRCLLIGTWAQANSWASEHRCNK